MRHAMCSGINIFTRRCLLLQVFHDVETSVCDHATLESPVLYWSSYHFGSGWKAELHIAAGSEVAEQILRHTCCSSFPELIHLLSS